MVASVPVGLHFIFVALVAALLFALPARSVVLPSDLKSLATLKSVGAAPSGAFGTTYQLSKGSLFAWQSKSPSPESKTEVVTIVIHGVDRNPADYFKAINDAFTRAYKAKMIDAPVNTLRIAPAFFAAAADSSKLNSSTLGWSDDNDWTVGYGSQHPSGSGMSSFTVLDELVQRFSDKSKYANVRKIIMVGHGGGAMLMSRYAALRQDSSTSGVALRYVVGNPSAMLYFTSDRPKAVSNSACSYYNEWFYGLDNYDAPYSLGQSPTGLFSAFAKRDVRYIVSLDDTSSKNGDQTCGARAQGGTARKDRTLSYWKYIHLLAGAPASAYSKFPGAFASLTGRNSNVNQFRVSGNNVSHKLYQVSGIGHDVYGVLTSSKGLSACFV